MSANHILLQKCHPERGQFRFYAVSVQPDLFGTWSLIREWGRISCSSRVRIDWHETEEAAEKAMQRKIREKQRRGYV